MGSDKQTIGFRADGELRSDIETYRRRNGFENQSDATKKLVEIGLREARGPLLFRLKGSAINLGMQLTLMGIIVSVFGAVTPILAVEYGVMAGGVLVAIAGGLLALVELTRAAAGRNEIGVGLFYGGRS